jgi:hypothetical protein
MTMTNASWIRRRMPPALLQRDFALLWAASLAMGLGSQMAAVPAAGEKLSPGSSV